MRKVGLYFGSFNPITLAHEHIAKYVIEQCELDELQFVISPQNPFKINQQMLDAKTRVEMVEAVCKDNDKMFINTVELTLSIPSYTYKTIETIRQDNEPYVEYYIIMGFDVFEKLHKWQHFEEILKYNIILLPRLHENNNIEFEDIVNELQAHSDELLKITYLKDMEMINISSTLVRTEIQNGNEPTNLLNPHVWNIIKEKKLYQNGTN